jgi:uncharacterized membrane protein
MKTMAKVGKKLNAAWASVVVFMAGAAVALADSNTTITLNNPIGTSSFTDVANNVIYFIATTIAIPLTAIMVLVGAFQITTSAGDPEKFSQGRKTILYAAIGFAIALVATGVTSIIKSLINGS